MLLRAIQRCMQGSVLLERAIRGIGWVVEEQRCGNLEIWIQCGWR